MVLHTALSKARQHLISLSRNSRCSDEEIAGEFHQLCQQFQGEPSAINPLLQAVASDDSRAELHIALSAQYRNSPVAT